MEPDLSAIAPGPYRPADPKPLGLGSRVFLGLLAASALPAMVYGGRELWRRFHPEDGEAVDEPPKQASYEPIRPLAAGDAVRAYAPGERGHRAALARYGF